MLNLEPKMVRVHSDGKGGFDPRFEFDHTEPLAWGDDVCILWCCEPACFPENGEHPMAELAALYDGIRAKMLPARQAHIFERMAQGAVLMTADEVCTTSSARTRG